MQVPLSERPAEVISVPARVLRRNWYLPAIGLAIALGVPALHQLHVFSERLGSIFSLLAVWIGGWFAVLTLLRNAFPLSRPATVVADAAGLHVDERLLRREDIGEARMLPQPRDQVRVELTLRAGGKRMLELARQDAERLLARLRLGVGERRTTFRIESRFLTRFFLSLLLLSPFFASALSARGFSPGRDLLTLLPGIMFWGALGAWFLGLLKGKLIIGADGLTVRWLLRERFVAFRDVESVDRVEPWLAGRPIQTELRLTSGKTLRFISPEAPVSEEDRGVEALALYEHTEAAYHLARLRGGGTTELLPLVRCGHQGARGWLTTLDSIARDDATGYRVSAVNLEQLADILRDPAQPSDARVGAAAALLRSGEPAHRVSVRVVADACADPALHRSLDDLERARDDEAFLDALQGAERGGFAVSGKRPG